MFKVISILSLYLHHSATLYLFFQTNTPAVLSILLSTLFKYTFLFILLSHLNIIFFILLYYYFPPKITNCHNKSFPPAATTRTTVNQPRATKNHRNHYRESTVNHHKPNKNHHKINFSVTKQSNSKVSKLKN